MKNKTLIIILLVALLCACVAPTPPVTVVTATPDYVTATPQPPPSATGEAGTATPTELPSATILPYEPPTSTPLVKKVERVYNSGFEGDYDLWNNLGGHTAPGWQPTFCNKPIVPEDCFIPPPHCDDTLTEDCNDPGKLITPEFKAATLDIDPARVTEGYKAQAWHCRSAHCWGGVHQEVRVNQGFMCDVEVDIQTWGAKDWHSNASGLPYLSDYLTDSDQKNMTFEIAVFVAGAYPPRPFSDDILERKEFGFEDGIYDSDGGARVSFEFMALREKAVIFFLGKNIYPNAFSEWYVDNASVKCDGDQAVINDNEVTPSPIAQP